MSYIRNLQVILVATACIVATALPAKKDKDDSANGPYGMRKWTSASGDKLVAQFVKLESGRVQLKKKDGSQTRIKLNNLSSNDQQVVRMLSASTPGVSARGLKKASDRLLTHRQINNLVTRWEDTKSHQITTFKANFEDRTLKDDDEARRYSKSGKIPYRITAQLSEQWPHGEPQYQSGSCRFYILDSDGIVIIKKTVSLESMRGKGKKGKDNENQGYSGDLPKSGKYTLVIWVKKPHTTYGRTLTKTL